MSCTEMYNSNVTQYTTTATQFTITTKIMAQYYKKTKSYPCIDNSIGSPNQLNYIDNNQLMI